MLNPPVSYSKSSFARLGGPLTSQLHLAAAADLLHIYLSIDILAAALCSWHFVLTLPA